MSVLKASGTMQTAIAHSVKLTLFISLAWLASRFLHGMRCSLPKALAE